MFVCVYGVVVFGYLLGVIPPVPFGFGLLKDLLYLCIRVKTAIVQCMEKILVGNKNTYAYLVMLISDTTLLLYSNKHKVTDVLEQYNLHSRVRYKKHIGLDYALKIDNKSKAIEISFNGKENFGDVLFIVDEYVTVYMEDVLLMDIGEDGITYYVDVNTINSNKDIVNVLPKYSNFVSFTYGIKKITKIINNELTDIVNKLLISDFTSYDNKTQVVDNIYRLLSGITPELSYPHKEPLYAVRTDYVYCGKDVFAINRNEEDKYVYVKLSDFDKFIKIHSHNGNVNIDFVTRECIPTCEELYGTNVLSHFGHSPIWVNEFISYLFKTNIKKEIFDSSMKFIEEMESGEN